MPIDGNLLTATDFIGVRAALVRELGGDANQALVLTRIYFRADKRWREAIEHKGVWWWRATYDTLAEETGLGVQQVRRAVRALIDADYLLAAKLHIHGSSDHTLSYRVITDVSDSTDHDVSDSTHLDVSLATDLPSIQKVKTLELFGGIEITEANTESHFAIWYQYYPKHVARGAARKAWLAAVKSKVDVDDLLAATKRFAEKVRRDQTDPKFVPHPATWLNAERWLDEDRVEGTGRDSIRSL